MAQVLRELLEVRYEGKVPIALAVSNGVYLEIGDQRSEEEVRAPGLPERFRGGGGGLGTLPGRATTKPLSAKKSASSEDVVLDPWQCRPCW